MGTWLRAPPGHLVLTPAGILDRGPAAVHSEYIPGNVRLRDGRGVWCAGRPGAIFIHYERPPPGGPRGAPGGLPWAPGRAGERSQHFDEIIG
jgi:hypothetical protein